MLPLASVQMSAVSSRSDSAARHRLDERRASSSPVPLLESRLQPSVNCSRFLQTGCLSASSEHQDRLSGASPRLRTGSVRLAFFFGSLPSLANGSLPSAAQSFGRDGEVAAAVGARR